MNNPHDRYRVQMPTWLTTLLVGRRSLHARLAVSLFALVLAATGCMDTVHGVEERPDEPAALEQAVVAKGRICVAPLGTDEATCVASGGDVAGAHRGARTTCGNCSYDMWPEFPAGMTFDQGARNHEAVAQLQSDVDGILAVAASQGAEAYAATLGGRLRQVLRRVWEVQSVALGQPDPRVAAPLARFESKIWAMAAVEWEPLVVGLATNRRTTNELSEILKQTSAKFAPLQQAYAALVMRFGAYKATEPALIADLTDFSKRASASELMDIPTVQTDLIDYVRASSSVLDELLMDATRLRASMSQLETQYRARLDPYASFLETNFGTAPQLSLVAQQSLSSITAYCEQRRLQTNALVSNLLRGIAARRDAFIAVAADAKTRTTFQQDAFLKASTAFLDEATARNTEISKVPPRTTKYGFPLWTDKYDQYVSVLELVPLCGAENDTTRPSWRDAGCASFRRSFGRARTYTTVTIPQLIGFTLPQLRSKGVAESLLGDIQTALVQGRVRDAAAQYDSAARLTENL